ncbi:MAG: AAA family ATPase [Candidatus Alcyoniella australis]|nr:AAA family ATPase [Candidatus Alcyoniella australis]
MPGKKVSKKPSVDHPELTTEQLRWRCDHTCLDFTTTAKAEPLDGILGQKRAVEALDLGLDLWSPGYNIYVAGMAGTGKMTTIRALLANRARSDVNLQDICYVNNFKDQNKPCVLKLPAGKGKLLKREMAELVDFLKKTVPEIFESDDFKTKRDGLVSAHREAQKQLFKELETKIKAENFVLVQVQMGTMVQPMVMPVIEEQPVAFDKLESLVEQGNFPRKKFDELKNKHQELHVHLETVMTQARNIEKQIKTDLKTLERSYMHEMIQRLIAEIAEKFVNGQIKQYLDAAFEFILDNLDRFREGEQQTPANPMAAMMMQGQAAEDLFTEFAVNVLVDRDGESGPPVIVENVPTYSNLFGTIEKTISRGGIWMTDFTKIRAGSILKADGGYLVINLLDAVTEPGVWKSLKRTLKTRKLEIEGYDPYYFLSASAMKPEPLGIDLKIVVVGDNHLYNQFYAWDEDFKKIFKIKAEFDHELDRSKIEIAKYAGFVKKIVEDEELRHFNRQAVALLVEEGVRMSGRQKKMTARFTVLADIIREADAFAARARSKVVSTKHLETAIEARRFRSSLIEEKMQEYIDEGIIRVEVKGKVAGQVNSLAVYQVGSMRFGKPGRVTAQVGMGRGGLTNIEREAKLSGSTHDKGVLILSGFLRSRFCQDKPLAISASICFEQSYSHIDGDSASSTELYALLSALSGRSIKQSIAVTGSVDQYGNVQAIGGANEKIEGFFDTCKARGLSGRQGVMIPRSNAGDLMLKQQVVDAVAKGRFHIWPVEHVDQGIEILTGVPAGKRERDGSWTNGSIMAKVDQRLVKLARGLRDFERTKSGKNNKSKSNADNNQSKDNAE